MEMDEINSTETTANSLVDRRNAIKSLLFRRYLIRMRQIRARRKIIQKLQQFKYLQYQQASEKLFTLFSMRLLNLYKLYNKKKSHKKLSNFGRCKTKKIFIRKLPNRKNNNNNIRPQYWWKNIFPNLNDDEFYYTFHLQREIYKNLCEQLQEKLMIQQNYGTNYDGTSVEKQVALCLFKLAHGYSYRKTGAIFGLHYATVHKLFSRFVRELINIYSNNISRLEYNECLEMNQNAINKIDITTPQIIGTLMRVKFTSSSELILYAHGIIDVDEKFHFVRIVKDANDHSFYAELDDACKKYYPNKGCYNYKESEMYLVVTDQIVPDYDCFLNKSILESNDNYEHNDDKSYIQKKADLLYSANAMLKCEENAISKLVERWNILAYQLDFTSKLLSSVVESCIILHNICQDYLIKNNMNFQSFNDVNIDNKFKNDKIIDITSDTENEEENYDDDDADDGVEEEKNKNNNQIDDDDEDDDNIDDDEDYEIDDDNDNINADLRDDDNDDFENNLNRHLNEMMDTEILSNYNVDDQNKNNNEEENYREIERDRQNGKDENDLQNKNKENNLQNKNDGIDGKIKNKENDRRNKNKENDRQNKSKENDCQNKNKENNLQNKNDGIDLQNKSKENDCQIKSKENDPQIQNNQSDLQNNDENDPQIRNNQSDLQNKNDENDPQIKNNENDPQIKNDECNDDMEVIEIIVHNNDNDDEQINRNINFDYGNCIIKTENELHNECNENEKIEIIVQQDNEKFNKNIHSNDNKNDKNEKVLNTNGDDDDELSFDKFVVQSVSDDTDVEDYDEDHSVYFYGDDND